MLHQGSTGWLFGMNLKGHGWAAVCERQALGFQKVTMTKQEFGQAQAFIYTDIGREIALAKASQGLLKRLFLRIAGVPFGGGNFMAALALLSYTEFAGRLKNNDFSDKNSRKNFDDFFADLGTDYKSFLASHNVYRIFRCGLAHEYHQKNG